MFASLTALKFYQPKQHQLSCLAGSLIMVAVVFSAANLFHCNATIVINLNGHPKVSFSAMINGTPVDCGNAGEKCGVESFKQKNGNHTEGGCGTTIWDNRLEIHGGEDVKLGELPWMALVGKVDKYAIHDEDTYYHCGGSLITDRYVITAGHCLMGQEKTVSTKMKVNLGAIERYPTDENKRYLKVFNVEKAILHEKYDDDSLVNDIGLLRLDSKVIFNDYIRPICLPSEGDSTRTLGGQEAMIAGWGQDESDIATEVLVKLPLTVVDLPDCQNSYKAIPNNMIDETVICAGGVEGKGACNGDSGGPLMWRDGQTPWIIVGITSWTFDGRCGTKGMPVVYTRVTAFLDWVLSHVGDKGKVLQMDHNTRIPF